LASRSTSARLLDEDLLGAGQTPRISLGQIARRLQTLKALKVGISERRATDILWFYLGREAWHLLVADHRWSWEEAER
jgi:hypothetical protein